MYNYHYENEQWLILSLGGGILLVLLITLSYMAGWNPRRVEPDGRARASRATARFIPWVLVVVYLAMFVYYFGSPLVWLYWPENW